MCIRSVLIHIKEYHISLEIAYHKKRSYLQNEKKGSEFVFVERCIFSKPIFKPESLAYISIKDNSDRFSEVKFEGWMFASSPTLNALENPVYDISILACIKVDKQSEKSSSVSPKERILTFN